VLQSEKKRNWNTNFMASVGARAYRGAWGLSLQWGPEAKPLVEGLNSGKSAGDETDSISVMKYVNMAIAVYIL